MSAQAKRCANAEAASVPLLSGSHEAFFERETRSLFFRSFFSREKKEQQFNPRTLQEDENEAT